MDKLIVNGCPQVAVYGPGPMGAARREQFTARCIERYT